MKINFKYFAFLFLVAIFISPNFANAAYLASDLLGQLDVSGNPVYTTNAVNNGEGLVNARGFSNVRGSVALDRTRHRLFVSDANNNRVLVFNLDENNNLIDRTADYVLGQPDFTTNTPSLTQSGMFTPFGIAYDDVNGRLFVASANQNRVLVFNVTTVTSGMNASYVLGQPDFTTSASATSQNGFNSVRGLTYDSKNSRLFVNEISNNRILVFDVAPGVISNGMNASYVLGQPDFTSSTAATTQSGINSPQEDMTYDIDTDRLFVGDKNNSRVLVYDLSSGITNGMNAANVFGWPSFASSASGLTQSTFGFARGTAYDPFAKQLFVGDDADNRILVFDATTIIDGENAIAVIGQSDFTSNTGGLTQLKVTSPNGMRFDEVNRRLYVSGLTNNRIMIFNFVKLSTTNPTDAYAGNIYSYTLSSTQSQGTVSYAVTSGSLPTGLSLNTSTGEISGTPTVAGTYTFTVQATDDNGAIGYFISQPQEYTMSVITYTLTYTAGTGGTLTGNTSQTVNRNADGSLVVAVPDDRYTFSSWSDGLLTTARTDLSVTSNINVNANFNRSTTSGSRPTRIATVPVVPESTTPTVQEPTTPSTTNYTFTHNLKLKDTGEEVKELQKYLNTHGYPVAIVGAGSLGNESTYFGVKTKTALIKFQLANMLVGDGIFGPLTREVVIKS